MKYKKKVSKKKKMGNIFTLDNSNKSLKKRIYWDFLLKKKNIIFNTSPTENKSSKDEEHKMEPLLFTDSLKMSSFNIDESIENTQERTIEGFKIYFDDEDVKYFDENEWRIDKQNPNKIYTLTNRKTKKQIHRIIMKVEDNKDIRVKFINPYSGDFRKKNLELIKNTKALKQEQNELEKTKHFVFVDTETTGLIPKIKNKWGNGGYISPRDKNAYENARLISVSYMITDGMNNTIMEPKHLYVKPNDFKIPSNITELTGITNEYAFKHGSHPYSVISEFEEDIKQHNVSFFVSHNVLFDSFIMQNSALRRGWTTDSLLLHLETKMRYYCTCKDPIIKELKSLKLNKSIIEILKEEPVGLHNALNDMMYCKRIFFELRHQNLI